MSELQERIKRFENAIAQLDAQRVILGDATVDASIIALREKLNALSSPSAREPEGGVWSASAARRRFSSPTSRAPLN